MSAVIASATSPRGELSLRRRDDGALELRVNGVFVMDDDETSSERALAALALERLSGAAARVLVGGLGLGFTVAALADSARVARIVVAELEPDLVDWVLGGLVPQTRRALSDPRVEVHVQNVRQSVRDAAPASLDAIVLDVDNGPAGLVHVENGSLYEPAFVSSCRRRLRRDGLLLVWSANESEHLHGVLTQVFGNAEHVGLAVRLQGRDESYHVYLARADGSEA